MQLVETKIRDVKILFPRKFEDGRGFFSESYNQLTLEKENINIRFVQDNHSLSVDKGVIRGLHYQTPPYAQDKLVRVVQGSIFDVAVDLRRQSDTFGKHVSRVISSKEWNQILVPIGFAHGFCTLEPNTEVIYKVSNFYAPECDKGIIWNDSELNIDWPVEEKNVLLSDNDKNQPKFSEVQDFF